LSSIGNAETPPRRAPGRRLSTFLYRRPRLRLGALLATPLGWLGIAYLGSLAVLFLAAFWRLDPLATHIVHDYSLDNFRTLVEEPVYRTITLRTVGTAAAVTVTDAVLAFPIAYYMARVATPRVRAALVVAVLTPLWASYLVKIYAWRIILQEDGVLNWALAPLGLSGPGFGKYALWLVFTYLWLPFMIIPIYAGLERLPSSLLEASSDLGARGFRTFRSVVLPITFPAVVAGSIFTFSLTLGDYIAPQIVGTRQFIGNVVYANVGVAGNLPLAAAFATVPVMIMIVYLLLARRAGAFEGL
jgi:putative spermidine/putrescine transport system permease protein